jgi:hypothetical protein
MIPIIRKQVEKELLCAHHLMFCRTARVFQKQVRWQIACISRNSSSTRLEGKLPAFLGTFPQLGRCIGGHDGPLCCVSHPSFILTSVLLC